MTLAHGIGLNPFFIRECLHTLRLRSNGLICWVSIPSSSGSAFIHAFSLNMMVSNSLNPFFIRECLHTLVNANCTCEARLNPFFIRECLHTLPTVYANCIQPSQSLLHQGVPSYNMMVSNMDVSMGLNPFFIRECLHTRPTQLKP